MHWLILQDTKHVITIFSHLIYSYFATEKIQNSDNVESLQQFYFI